MYKQKELSLARRLVIKGWKRQVNMLKGKLEFWNSYKPTEDDTPEKKEKREVEIKDLETRAYSAWYELRKVRMNKNGSKHHLFMTSSMIKANGRKEFQKI